jgi:hypothetical protein
MRITPRAARTSTGRLVSDLVVLALLVVGLLVAVPPDRRDYARIAFVAALLFTVVMARRLLGPGGRPAVVARVPRDPPVAAADYVSRLARLTGSLEAGGSSRAKFDLTVRPLLYRVAVDRLCTRHGLDLAGVHAAAARHRLGEDLWQLFADTRPPAYDEPPPSLDDVQRWVTAVERI